MQWWTSTCTPPFECHPNGLLFKGFLYCSSFFESLYVFEAYILYFVVWSEQVRFCEPLFVLESFSRRYAYCIEVESIFAAYLCTLWKYIPVNNIFLDMKHRRRGIGYSICLGLYIQKRDDLSWASLIWFITYFLNNSSNCFSQISEQFTHKIPEEITTYIYIEPEPLKFHDVTSNFRG